MRVGLIVVILNIVFSFNVFSSQYNPLYVSLRSNEVNLREGPGNEYSIKYVYQLKDLPVRVLGEYDNWYKVIDKDNDKGWINKNLTTKKRSLIVINGTQIMYKKDDINSDPILRLEENVIVKYDKCTKTWCKVEIDNKTGWMQKTSLWGYDV